MQAVLLGGKPANRGAVALQALDGLAEGFLILREAQRVLEGTPQARHVHLALLPAHLLLHLREPGLHVLQALLHLPLLPAGLLHLVLAEPLAVLAHLLRHVLLLHLLPHLLKLLLGRPLHVLQVLLRLLHFLHELFHLFGELFLLTGQVLVGRRVGGRGLGRGGVRCRGG